MTQRDRSREAGDSSTAGWRLANAPCSWGSLEFEGLDGEVVAFGRMLDELAETGFVGTELGDWGYMPTEPDALRGELEMRGIDMVGAFVPVRLRDSRAHARGRERALRAAGLLTAVAGKIPPRLVLSDDNGTDPERVAKAGRVPPGAGLDESEWAVFAEGASEIARAVFEETGLQTAFHHHCAGFVETPAEIRRFLELTDPDHVGLTFDTGHYAFGASDAEAVPVGLTEHAERIRHVHFKDFDPSVAAAVSRDGGGYFEAVRRGVFCELGDGQVDFSRVLEGLRSIGYEGWIVVEQDVLPGMGAPRESARRNRTYLSTLGI